MDFKTIFIDGHHALLLSARNRGEALTSVKDYLDDIKHIYEVTESNVIDIDTARELKSWSIKSYGAPKVMILSFHTITVPAQNALLKVLEEPQADSRFVLITSNVHALLPTVRSRVQEHHVTSSELTIAGVRVFLATSPQDRMKLGEIEELLEAKDESDKKDREKLQAFISSLLETLVQERVNIRILEEVATFARYASDPSSSAKTLLEYLSLRVPRIAL